MAGRIKLTRKSYFVDERALNRAKKAFGVKTEAEVIRLSVERVAEMEEFWEFMKKIAGLSDPEAWRNPEMAVAILDTRVYIDHWERGLHQDSKRLDSNNAAAQTQWSRTEARMLSERSRAIPDAIPKMRAPPEMRNH